MAQRLAPFVLVACVSLALGCGSGSSGGNTPSGPPQGTTPLAQEPANVVGGFSADFGDPALPAITLQPGQELFPCIIFPLNLTGPSHVVGGGLLTPQPGLHHGNIVTAPIPAGTTLTAPMPCPNVDPTNPGNTQTELGSVLQGGSVLFASTTQIQKPEWRSFPPGMGFRIKDGFEIIAFMHYLNTTTQPLTIAPKYQWFTIDESKLTQELYPFFWQLTNFSIPPHTQQTFIGQCDLPTTPTNMMVVNALAHMHQLGTALNVSYVGGPWDGKNWFETPGYSTTTSLQLQYAPAANITAGTGIRMECTWNNVTDQTIVEGTGINEMCMMFGYSYPAQSTYTFKVSPGDNPRSCAYVVSGGIGN